MAERQQQSAAATRNPAPGGHGKQRLEAQAVACSILKGIHRWAAPFSDGDTCACGALYLDAHPAGAAAFEVSDQ